MEPGSGLYIIAGSARLPHLVAVVAVDGVSLPSVVITAGVIIPVPSFLQLESVWGLVLVRRLLL